MTMRAFIYAAALLSLGVQAFESSQTMSKGDIYREASKVHKNSAEAILNESLQKQQDICATFTQQCHWRGCSADDCKLVKENVQPCTLHEGKCVRRVADSEDDLFYDAVDEDVDHIGQESEENFEEFRKMITLPNKNEVDRLRNRPYLEPVENGVYLERYKQAREEERLRRKGQGKKVELRRSMHLTARPTQTEICATLTKQCHWRGCSASDCKRFLLPGDRDAQPCTLHRESRQCVRRE